MRMGRWHPSIVMDVQVLVTHAPSVTIMEREMGHPPRIIRGPDLCYLFQQRGCRGWWTAGNRMASRRR
jgi:hypothetical protein